MRPWFSRLVPILNSLGLKFVIEKTSKTSSGETIQASNEGDGIEQGYPLIEEPEATTENEMQDDFDDVGAYDYDLYKEDPGIETEDAEEQRLSVKEKLENAPQLLVEKR